MTKQSIIKLTAGGEHLTVYYADAWFQEDISSLITLVFSRLHSTNIQEKIMGADRENVRFSWEGNYFILNFDCSSQSCWIEGQDSKGTAYLATLYSTLQNSEKNVDSI